MLLDILYTNVSTSFCIIFQKLLTRTACQKNYWYHICCEHIFIYKTVVNNVKLVVYNLKRVNHIQNTCYVE